MSLQPSVGVSAEVIRQAQDVLGSSSTSGFRQAGAGGIKQPEAGDRPAS